MMEKLEIFCPATVANVSCGFDTLGFALSSLGDRMVFQKTAAKEIKITHIEGASLPYNIGKNVAGVVTKAMLEAHGFPFGVNIEIYKNYPPGSGLGSSAASSAGAAYALNELLGQPYSNLEMVQYARRGEEVACGSPIADNVSACIYGGFIMVQRYEPLKIISLPTPGKLYATVIHPHIEIKTEDARKILPKQVPLTDAIRQWANVGGLVSGLYESNYERIATSLEDVIIEPYRKSLIPHFDELQRNALSAGALGAGISGSGPSVFALSKGEDIAKEVGLAFQKVYDASDLDYRVYVSAIGKGVRMLTTDV